MSDATSELSWSQVCPLPTGNGGTFGKVLWYFNDGDENTLRVGDGGEALPVGRRNGV